MLSFSFALFFFIEITIYFISINKGDFLKINDNDDDNDDALTLFNCVFSIFIYLNAF